MKKILFIFCFCVYGAHGAEFRYADIAALRGIVPQTGEFYTISDQVTLEANQFVFIVSSVHQNSRRVVGIPRLIRECHETTEMERYYATPQGSEVWNGLKDKASDTWEGTKQVVKHPGDSAVAIGRSAKRSGRAVKSFFKNIGKDEKNADGQNLQHGAGNFFTSDLAREVAYGMRLDPYSRNPEVQRLLSAIALKRAVGGAVVSVGTSMTFAPVAPMGMLSATQFVVYGALTPGAYLEATEIMVRDNPPAELYLQLEKELTTVGFDPNGKGMLLFRTLTENPNYTPRDKAYLVAFLIKNGNLPMMENVLRTLATAQTVDEADNLYYQLQMLSSFNHEFYSLTDYAANDFNIAGITEKGEAVLILPFDYFDDPQGFEDDIAFLNSIPAKQRTVWVFGAATNRFKEFLSQQKVAKLFENIVQFAVKR